MFPRQSGTVEAKSEDYYQAALFMQRVAGFEAVVICVLSVVLAVYLGNGQNQDRYMAETSDGKVMQMAALSYPNMGRMALSDWVANAASQIMTFGFNDVDVRFSESRRNFTKDGWDTFRKAIIASTVIDEIMKTQQIVSAVPESPPVLKSEGLVNGVYSWTFDVPLLITFRAGGDKKSASKMAHVVVERVPTRESPNGVGISEWYMR